MKWNIQWRKGWFKELLQKLLKSEELLYTFRNSSVDASWGSSRHASNASKSGTSISTVPHSLTSQNNDESEEFHTVCDDDTSKLENPEIDDSKARHGLVDGCNHEDGMDDASCYTDCWSQQTQIGDEGYDKSNEEQTASIVNREAQIGAEQDWRSGDGQGLNSAVESIDGSTVASDAWHDNVANRQGLMDSDTPAGKEAEPSLNKPQEITRSAEAVNGVTTKECSDWPTQTQAIKDELEKTLERIHIQEARIRAQEAKIMEQDMDLRYLCRKLADSKLDLREAILALKVADMDLADACNDQGGCIHLHDGTTIRVRKKWRVTMPKGARSFPQRLKRSKSMMEDVKVSFW